MCTVEAQGHQPLARLVRIFEQPPNSLTFLARSAHAILICIEQVWWCHSSVTSTGSVKSASIHAVTCPMGKAVTVNMATSYKYKRNILKQAGSFLAKENTESCAEILSLLCFLLLVFNVEKLKIESHFKNRASSNE
ncbi:hypothetical protein RRG08_000702 [Elysia crispata]|uniref:Uncharacterized protein n=1 Tax=Elysia crispata TaxID=231223 RepID=A0AAE1E5U7_9GAST|nr:hypothetical protein RRG08_000702 [Elysia crispata]